MRFVRESLWSRLMGRGRWSRQDVACAAYFGLSLVSVVGFVLLNAWVFLHASRS
jgi:hypothetical protein